eukprot:1722783-Rhodomonas_salina.2
MCAAKLYCDRPVRLSESSIRHGSIRVRKVRTAVSCRVGIPSGGKGDVRRHDTRDHNDSVRHLAKSHNGS